MKGALALLLAALVLGAGCRSLTGQSAGEWMGDRTITAKVKTRLATGGKGLTLMRVHVDTYDDTVYLTGAVETPALKERAEAIAREVRGVRLVVNNIHVPRGETNGQGHEAASPATEAAVASDRDVPRALARGKRLARLDPETGTPGWTRYAGYDHAGRRIATVYAVTADELARRGITGLAGEHLSIEQVGVYPDGERYYIVLWHVNAEESARLHGAPHTIYFVVMRLRVLVLLGAVVFGAGNSALATSVTLDTSPAIAAAAPRTPRERVDHHVRHATELADHLETALRKDCPRFATAQEWEAYVDAEIDRVALMMAHLEQAWVEAKSTPDDDVRRAAKAPRRRLGEARELLGKLQGCARENGSSLGTLGLWRRVEREVHRRQAEIALPQ